MIKMKWAIHHEGFRGQAVIPSRKSIYRGRERHHPLSLSKGIRVVYEHPHSSWQ
jgi:hypothetical protein